MVNDATAPPILHWSEDGEERAARWRTAGGVPPAARVMVTDGQLPVEEAYGHICQGTALLWRGDYQDARRMLDKLAKRADRPRGSRHGPAKRRMNLADATSDGSAFHLYRQANAQRARTLNALLVPLDPDYSIPLRRAPDARQACVEAFGTGETPSVISLRALLGVIGAHEWRKKGIEIPEAGGRIHPHYGVFAPVRREYVDLVSTTPLPAALASRNVAFDIGTGTGVLAAVLARRGIERVLATDLDVRAIVCARDNINRLELAARVEVIQADLYPEGRAALIVCNPPWLPARPSSALESALYDPESRMRLGFLAQLSEHLEPGGEGWLILSDLAEHLGLRTRAQLLDEFATAGLRVVGRHDVAPRHPRAADESDPLHAARAAEITSLWRLAPR